jgi:DNA-directed RNA polymerase specialized sigma24 family protein
MEIDVMDLSILDATATAGGQILRITNERRWPGACRTTCWSVVLAAAAGGEGARAALDKLYRAYWNPVFSFIAKRRGAEAARELAQGFFVNRVIEHNDLRRVQRRPGQRFRGWLYSALRSYLCNQWKFERQQRRDVRKTLALGSEDEGGIAPSALVDGRLDPERQLQRARVLKLLSDVLGRLRREYCRNADAPGVDAPRRFDAVKVYLAGPYTEAANYRARGAELRMSADAVKQLVLRLRKRFGQLLHERIRQSVDGEADVAVAKLLLCQALETPPENHQGA